MYRLMVVEDEEMIRKGIVNAIPWNSLGFTVVAESINGKDALDQLESIPVDVLITDIKMPIMGGVELSQKARQLYPDIEIIVLSGFSDFEYARQAISFRAFDYLLKPTNKKKLMDAFEALKESMDEKKEIKEEFIHNSAYINAGYEIKRNEFIQSMIEGDINVFSDFDEKTASLELDFSGHYFCAATIKFDRKSVYEEITDYWETDKRLLTISYNNTINEILRNIDNAYHVVADYDVINLIFCFKTKEEEESKLIQSLEKIVYNINNCLFKNVQVPFTIGIGLSYPSIHHIAKSYAQAKKSIQNSFYLSEQKIQIYEDNYESNYEQNYIQFYPGQMDGVALAVGNGSYSETKKHLRTMFSSLKEQKILPEIVKNYCIALKFMVQSKISNEYKMAEKIFASDYNDFVKEALTVKELESYVIDIMVALAREIDETVDMNLASEQHLLIEKSKQFIKEHLNEKINLKIISEHVFLSETYFSFLFKKVAGTTYIDYIQKLRMKEAKRLLLSTRYKIYEIAEMIGYSDYKYFSGQFKKYVAMTPKEYRNKGLREGLK